MKKLLILLALMSAMTLEAASQKWEWRTGTNTVSLSSDIPGTGNIGTGYEIGLEVRNAGSSFEYGIGAFYSSNKVESSFIPGTTVNMGRISSGPVYFVGRYNFPDIKRRIPYIKGKAGIAFNGGKKEASYYNEYYKLQNKNGFYSGISVGFETPEKNSFIEISYSVNSFDSELTTKKYDRFRQVESESRKNFLNKAGILTLSMGIVINSF